MFFQLTLLCLTVSARIRQTDRLPLDVEEWINQANLEDETVGDLSGSKFQTLAEESDILPSDVKEWIEQINEEKDIEWPSKLEPSDSPLIDINGQNGPSDCSIVVTLWKKMGKETTLDPKTVSPTGCCMTSKESDFDHVRCVGDQVIQMYELNSNIKEIGVITIFKVAFRKKLACCKT